jgi:hypothetical protein
MHPEQAEDTASLLGRRAAVLNAIHPDTQASNNKLLAMQHAHEKLVQAQRYFMAAQVMRQADHSGRLPGAPESKAGVSPRGAPGGGVGGAANGRSGNLATDNSDVTQWTSRTHDNSLSAVAQSYMSTQNTSGARSSPFVLGFCPCCAAAC